MVKEYISMPLPKRGEVFTHKDDDGTLRTFPVCVMRDFAKQYAATTRGMRHIIMRLDPESVEHTYLQFGIEEDRLARLRDPYLHEPIICISWDTPERGSEKVTVIDGNHRVVKLYSLGELTVKAIIFPRFIWEQFLLAVPNAGEMLTKRSGILELEKELQNDR